MKKFAFALMALLIGVSAHAEGGRLGAHFGKYSPSDIESGNSIGLEYSFNVSDNLFAGGFFDHNTADYDVCYDLGMGYDECVTGSVTSNIFGALVGGKHDLGNNIELYGAGKLGLALTSGDFVASDDIAIIFEAGARYRVNPQFDIGANLRYMILEATADDDNSYKLGGTTISIAAGISF